MAPVAAGLGFGEAADVPIPSGAPGRPEARWVDRSRMRPRQWGAVLNYPFSSEGRAHGTLMSAFSQGRRGVIALAFGLAAAWCPAVARAQGVVTGRVIDTASNAPIPDVQIRVEGTTFGTATKTDGTYRLTGLKPGPVTLRALRLGFQSLTHPATVPEAGSVAVDFALTLAASTLDQVVVQATGETQRVRENGNSVGLISPENVPKAAVASFSDVLSSRAPGVTVTQQSGTAGGTSKIRIRGNNSVSLDNGPLLVVDGVRAESDQNATDLNVGGQAPSRFDDLDPSEIEDIQVLKGPSAAALYGTAGANGVIQVTTKHGRSGNSVWKVNEEYGTIRNFVSYPANFARIGRVDATLPDTGANRVTQCTLYAQGLGSCTPFADSLVSFNPLATYSPTVSGWRNNFGLSVSGGTDKINYFASGQHKDEHGVYPNNYVNRSNGRANLHAILSPVVDLTANVGYLQSGIGLPQNDNASFGVLSGGLLGQAFNDPSTHGYSGGVTPEKLAQVTSTQSITRYTASVTGTWRPLKWLSVVGVTGLDLDNSIDRQLFPLGVSPIFLTGYVQTDPLTNRQYTTNVTGTAHYDVSPSLTGTTSVGTQYTDQTHNSLIAFGQGLLPGTGTLAGANTNFSITEDNPQDVLFGGLIQQQLGWRNKVFFTAAVRSDKNSSIHNVGWTTYPGASLSWVIGEEGFFPKNDVVSSLRLRTAYGQSGQRPTSRQPRNFFTAAGAKKDGVELLGAIDTATGNPNLTAEISREAEAGLDVGVWGERLNVQFTYYNKTTSGALVQRVLPPGTGGNVQFVNLGQVSNKGVEMQLSGTIVDTRPFTAELTVNGSVNHNKLVKLGRNIQPVGFDGGVNGDTQMHTPGYSLGGYWANPYTFSDLNHDGILQPNELVVDLTRRIFYGNSQPTDEFAVTPALTFFKALRLTALFDRRAGALNYNGTEQFRCGGSFVICQELYDPRVGLSMQARALVAFLGKLGSDRGAFEDASFWKLREITARYTAPSSWARRIGASELSLSISGRNLHTWTNYSGFDPEINYAPNAKNGYNPFVASDFLTQPPVRYWTGRVDLTW